MATRTWVSGVGDDVNPCSRTAPCKTFAGAISKTASGGEIDVLDPGGFGAVTITKGITLDGTHGSGFGSILASNSNGIVINAGNGVVTLRNLSINGAGTGICGIRILSAQAVYVEHCEIFGFQAASGTDAGIGLRDARTTGATLFVTGCTFRNNRTAGITLLPSAGINPIIATIDNCWIQGHAGNGLSALAGSRVTISNSILTSNAGTAIACESGSIGTDVSIENCMIAHNNIGVSISNGTPNARLSNNTIVNNTVGMQLTSGTMFTFGNNRVSANGSGNVMSVNGNIAPR